MTIRVIDFETTGLPPDASVCEAASVDLVGDPPLIQRRFETLVEPTTDMTLEALAVHHITEAEAIMHGSLWHLVEEILVEGIPAFYAAHNAEFEKAFFNPQGSRWIDTYKVALRLWPDSPSHSNQVLRYCLQLDVGGRAMPPHRALPDAWVTAHILVEALKLAPAADLEQWSDEPPFLTKLTFGKHRGMRFDEVPRDYLEWIARQRDMDAGVIAAAKRVLGK